MSGKFISISEYLLEVQRREQAKGDTEEQKPIEWSKAERADRAAREQWREIDAFDEEAHTRLMNSPAYRKLYRENMGNYDDPYPALDELDMDGRDYT